MTYLTPKKAPKTVKDQRKTVALLLLSLCGWLFPQGVWAQNATPIFENVTIRPRFSPDPMVIRGISGGSIPADRIAGRVETPTGPCVGFTDREPDHTLELKAFFNYLSLQVQSPEDTTLIIKGPGGTWCNDESAGKNPGIAGQWQRGKYRVWVGSYRANEYHPYLMRITEVNLLNPGPFRR